MYLCICVVFYNTRSASRNDAKRSNNLRHHNIHYVMVCFTSKRRNLCNRCMLVCIVRHDFRMESLRISSPLFHLFDNDSLLYFPITVFHSFSKDLKHFTSSFFTSQSLQTVLNLISETISPSIPGLVINL